MTTLARELPLILLLAAAAPAWAAKPAASSHATADGEDLTADLAFDGLLSTGWAEGAMGDGAEEWIEIRFDRPVDVRSISLYPGNLSGPNRVIREYGRPKLVTLTLEGSGDEPVEKQERLLDPGDRGEPLRHDVMIEADGVRKLRIRIDEAFSGGIHSDTYLAEVVVNMVAGEPVGEVAELQEWLASDDGQEASAEHREQAIALFETISSAEFGDRDSLFQLMDWAADGAPYLRERVVKAVPAGFRLQALQPDKTSIEALLKLKDSNAIPAIQRASLRTTGALSEDLARRAQMFEAYQDLRGGGARNVPPWGQSGFSEGALQSFGEPLAIQVDNFGGVYVADVANHRVQRFGMDSGVVDEVWGAPEPSMTDVWFYKTREFYAAGSQPGTEPGQFVHPVDLEVVHDKKEGDSVLVLDAKGRVTLIGPSGNVANTLEIDTETDIGPAVGGEGHIVQAKGQIIVILGNEAFVYDLEEWGTEIASFDLEDGVPNGAVGFKNGKFALVYGDELILYSTDGFRHGDIMLGALGEGFQDWGIATDERGKLWAITDAGELIKFKKPGKVDFRVPMTEYSLEVPRLDVYDDLVFVTFDDKILKADALELKARADAGEAAGSQLSVGDDL